MISMADEIIYFGDECCILYIDVVLFFLRTWKLLAFGANSYTRTSHLTALQWAKPMHFQNIHIIVYRYNPWYTVT